MKAVGSTGLQPELAGLIAAAFVLLFMIAGSLPETRDTSLEIEGMPCARLIR